MKTLKIINILVFLLFFYYVNGQQGIINQGAILVISNNLEFNLGSAQNDFINLSVSNSDYGTINNDGNIVLKGDWKNDLNHDVFINSNTYGKVTLSSSSQQIIGGSYPTNFESITINNGTDIELQNDISVSEAVNLNSGRISLQSYNLKLLENAEFIGNFSADKCIVANSSGFLQKEFGSANESFTFPLGSYNGSIYEYSPAELTINSGSLNNNASISMNVTDMKLLEYILGADNTDYLERYWTVNQSNFASINYSIDFQYTDNDVVGLEENIYAAKFDANEMEFFAVANVTTNTISFQNLESLSFFTGTNIDVSVNNIEELGTIYIYPNPGNGIFFIKTNNLGSTDLIISIYNTLGIKLISDNLSSFQSENGSNIYKVNLENYPSGVYFVRINSENSARVQKLIKE